MLVWTELYHCQPAAAAAATMSGGGICDTDAIVVILCGGRSVGRGRMAGVIAAGGG